MIIKSINLHNFRRYKEASMEFPTGLVGIVGRNGTGKSTLIESIGWCLYGSSASRTGKEGIKRTGCQPSDDCKVSLELTLGEDAIRVEREIRGKNAQAHARLFVNGNTKPHVNTVQAVTDYITKRTGMDYVAFFTSVFARQKELNALSNMDPRERKDTIMRLLKIDKIEDVIVNIRSDIRETRERIDYIKSIMKNIDELTQKEVDLEQDKTAKEDEIKVTKNEIIILKKTEKSEQKGFNTQEKKFRQHTKISSTIDAFTERRNGKDDQKKINDNDLDRAKKHKERLRLLQPQLKDFAQIKKEKKSLDAIYDKFKIKTSLGITLNDIRSEIDENVTDQRKTAESLFPLKNIDTELKGILIKIKQIDRKSKTAEASINQLKSKIKERQLQKKKLEIEFSKIKNLGNKSKCPTCDRILGEHHGIITKHFQNEIKKIQDEIYAMNSKKSKLSSNIVTLSSQIEILKKEEQSIRKKKETRTQLQEKLKMIGKNITSGQKKLGKTQNQLKKYMSVIYDKSRHDLVKSELVRLTKINEECIGLQTEVNRIPIFESRINQLLKLIQKLDVDIRINEEKLQKVDFDEDKYQFTKRSLADIKLKHQKKRELVITIQGDLKQILVNIAQNKQTIVEEGQKRESVNVDEKKIESRSKLEKTMQDFKIDLMSRIRPMLSSRASELFRQLTNGKYANMDLDDDYNIRIEDQGDDFGIERFSGGEEDLANLCLRIAISQELSERAGGGRATFIALDEIFGSQDEERKENILKALSELSNMFRQIFIITHVENINETLPYVLHIKEDSNGMVKVETEGTIPAAAA